MQRGTELIDLLYQRPETGSSEKMSGSYEEKSCQAGRAEPYGHNVSKARSNMSQLINNKMNFGKYFAQQDHFI
jgi:hypothetical protein